MTVIKWLCGGRGGKFPPLPLRVEGYSSVMFFEDSVISRIA